MYVKLNKNLLFSPAWANQPLHAKVAWIGLLCLADDNGVVYGTTDALALISGLSTEQMQDALNRFMNPNSTGTNCLISLGNNKYKLLNIEEYTGFSSEDRRRAYMAEYMRQKRQAQKNITNIQRTQSQGGAQ